MQEVTDISRADESSKLKDLTDARIKRDVKDLEAILDYLHERQTFFASSHDLHMLSYVLIAEGSAYFDLAASVGNHILIGICCWKCCLPLVTVVFSEKSKLTLQLPWPMCQLQMRRLKNNEKIKINRQQLYQRLIVAGIGI